jgi:hypothetical protein
MYGYPRGMNHHRPSGMRNQTIVPRNYQRDLHRNIPGSRRRQSAPPKSIEPGKTLDEATVFLVKHIDGNQGAIADFIWKRRNTRRPNSLKDAAHRCLEGFGHSVFADQIHAHNVAIRDRVFQTLEMAGRTYMAGKFGEDRQPDLIHIHLNSQLLQPRALRYPDQADMYDHIMATVLHHMIHAYFLAACGTQNDGKEADGRLKHEEHFGCIMYKIKELSGKYGAPLPIGFGHTIPPNHSPDHVHHEFGRGHSPFSRSRQYAPTECSTCLARMDEIEEESIKDWYKNKCIKAVDPDIFQIKGRDPRPVATPLSQCPDKKQWIEIIYKDQTYRVDRGYIRKFRSFKTRFDGDNRTLVMPDELEFSIFTCFLHYLDRNDYLPDIKDVSEIPSAPVISDRLYEGQGSIKTDIKVHQLATVLGFTDLRMHALKRLKYHPTCLESPTAILEEIYTPGFELNVELRTWATEFMKKYAQPKPGQHPIETSNWKKLNENPAFQELLNSFTDYAQLRVDFHRVGEGLKALEAVPLPSPPPPPPPPSSSHPGWHLTTQYAQPPWYTISPQAQSPNRREGTWPSLPTSTSTPNTVEPSPARGWWTVDEFGRRAWYGPGRPEFDHAHWAPNGGWL